MQNQCLNCGEPCEDDFCCDSCEEEYFEGEAEED